MEPDGNEAGSRPASTAQYRALKAFIDASPDFIFAKDLDHRLTLVNAAFAAAMDLTAADMEGHLDTAFWPAELCEKFHADDRRAFAGEVVHNPDDRATFADGSLHVFDTIKGPLRDDHGRIAGVFSISRDVTARAREAVERRRAEHALEASEDSLRRVHKLEAIGRLAGGVAHDFNNLLTVILGLGGTLRRALAADAHLATLADDIIDAGERAAALTRQLLTFAQAERGSRRVVDLGDQIRGLTAVVSRLIGDQVTLATALADDLHPVEIDPSQLEQVVINLAVNARDAMPGGGRLVIEAGNVVVSDPALQIAGPCVHLVVRDHGTGMSAEVRARLFEPFFTTKAPNRGTGLGLATVYGIVRQADGDITVESSPGAGTTFHIYLPRAARPVPPRVAAAAVRGGHEAVLVVEDDALVRTVTRRVLVEGGYRVTEAPGGAEALAIAETAQVIDVVVSDVVMPGMTGPEMVARLRALRGAVPVLFVTGHAGNEPAIERLGPILHKPFTPRALLAAVRAVLDRRTPIAAAESPGAPAR